MIFHELVFVNIMFVFIELGFTIIYINNKKVLLPN